MASPYFSSTKTKTQVFYLCNNNNNNIQKKQHLLSLRARDCRSKLLCAVRFPRFSSSINFDPLRFSVDRKDCALVKKKERGLGMVCYAGAVPISARNLQWISVISSAVLMLSKGTAIRKSFLVPLLALQAPASVISWMKGEYGIWTALVALLVRLFFFIPGELELPLMALLLVIVAPYQVMNLRETQQSAIIALVIAGYLAFQHFSWAGSFQKAFEQGSIIATVAVICITITSCLLLI